MGASIWPSDFVILDRPLPIITHKTDGLAGAILMDKARFEFVIQPSWIKYHSFGGDNLA